MQQVFAIYSFIFTKKLKLNTMFLFLKVLLKAVSKNRSCQLTYTLILGKL